MCEIIKKSLYEHYLALRCGEYSSEELTRAYLDEIDRTDASVGAYITVEGEKALKTAKEFDDRQRSGVEQSPLSGIPCAFKDNICTKGIKTTCASKMLENYVPPYSATVADKLEKCGAVLLGKLNMDEFAMGSSCENSAFKITRNPADLTRTPGGSSGGSAAAVAANMAVYTLGSDTGGSIRQPASFCGVVGMKPTYGAVSRSGLVAFASSLEQIGPITKTVLDNAMVLGALVGHDPMDSTTVKRSFPDFTEGIKNGARGLRVGIAQEFMGEGLSDDVRECVLGAAEAYKMMGADIVEVSIPSIKYSLPAYYIMSSAEASSNLARFDGIRFGHRAEQYSNIEELYKKSRSEGFGTEVKKRIMLGTFALSSGYYDEYYKKAYGVRKLIQNDFKNAFEKCDVIISPVAPTVAYKLGEKIKSSLEMYMGDIYSVSVNIAGLPALAVPCGHGKEGLPVGMQLIGPAFSEALLYRAGYAYEAYHNKGER